MAAEPDPGHFPMRNRIIAGLSHGVLVVEGSKKSGALITARLATEYNREVFAVPGRVDVPTAEAPNSLIQRGEAKLVTCLEDIFDELGDVWKPLRPEGQQELPFESQPAPLQLEPIEQRIFDALTNDARTLDEICEQSQLPAGQVASALTLLQLKGAIKQLPGGFFARRPGRPEC
jgi:DNA processing protein